LNYTTYTSKMAGVNSAKLSNLRNFLSSKSHYDIIRIYLYQKHDNLLRYATIVTLYRNWSRRPPYGLTEIGIATYCRQQVDCGLPLTPGPHAENLLKDLWSMHIRIRSHAHLPSANGPFHFGTTVFATHEEAMDLLHQIWHQPIDTERPDKGCRPVIFLSFGNNDALSKIRNTAFDFVPSGIDTTVAVLNVQDIAVQAKITRSNDATIEYLFPIFKATPFHVENAGNAATYITAIAFFSVLRQEIYGSGENPRARPSMHGLSAAKSAQSVMQWLMERPTPAPPFGVTTYCWRCSSFLHKDFGCPKTDIVCRKCLVSKAKWRQENANTHMEGLCIFR
jgi:hypothetical protein